MPARIAIFLSGTGRTMLNLADRIDAGALDARIVLVVASRPCPGADRARARGLPTLVVPGNLDAGRLVDLVDEHAIDWIVLAGYLRLLPVPARLSRRIVNIHPALLPDFGGTGMHGMHVHRAVMEAYRDGRVRETGCTVHLCDQEYDHGPIIAQTRVPIAPEDTPGTLADKVFDAECRTYPEALKRLFAGNDAP